MPYNIRLAFGPRRRQLRLLSSYGCLLAGCGLVVQSADPSAPEDGPGSIPASVMIVLGLLLHPGSLQEPGVPVERQAGLVPGIFTQALRCDGLRAMGLFFIGAADALLRLSTTPWRAIQEFVVSGIGLPGPYVNRSWARSVAPRPYVGLVGTRGDVLPFLVNLLLGMLLDASIILLGANNTNLVGRATHVMQWRLDPVRIANMLLPMIVRALIDRGLLAFLASMSQVWTDAAMRRSPDNREQYFYRHRIRIIIAQNVTAIAGVGAAMALRYGRPPYGAPMTNAGYFLVVGIIFAISLPTVLTHRRFQRHFPVGFSVFPLMPVATWRADGVHVFERGRLIGLTPLPPPMGPIPADMMAPLEMLAPPSPVHALSRSQSRMSSALDSQLEGIDVELHIEVDDFKNLAPRPLGGPILLHQAAPAIMAPPAPGAATLSGSPGPG